MFYCWAFSKFIVVLVWGRVLWVLISARFTSGIRTSGEWEIGLEFIWGGGIKAGGDTEIRYCVLGRWDSGLYLCWTIGGCSRRIIWLGFWIFSGLVYIVFDFSLYKDGILFSVLEYRGWKVDWIGGWVTVWAGYWWIDCLGWVICFTG